jgi:hypothetical protein
LTIESVPTVSTPPSSIHSITLAKPVFPADASRIAYQPRA